MITFYVLKNQQHILLRSDKYYRIILMQQNDIYFYHSQPK